MEDNLYDTFAKVRARGLARAMSTTKQVKAANVFNNGFRHRFLVEMDNRSSQTLTQ